MPSRVAKPTRVRSKGARKTSTKLLASDDVTLSAQLSRSLLTIKAELAKNHGDLLPAVTRLHRTLRGVSIARFDHFARQQGGIAILLDVIRVCSSDEAVAVPAVQALSMTTGCCPKLAARLAKRTTGTALLRAFNEYKGTRNDALMADLLSSIADIAAHDGSIGVAFASRGWATYLVDFARKHLRSVTLVFPAVRALASMINPTTAVSFCGAGGVALAMTLVQSYSVHIKYHEILKQSLKLLAACVQHDTGASGRSQRGGVRKLLALLVEWMHLDVRHKHDDVRREIVAVLTRMVGSNEGGGGSQAFRDVGGIGIVLDIIEECKASHHDANARFISSCYTLLRCARPQMQLPAVPSDLCFVLPTGLRDVSGDARVYGAEDELPDSDEDDCVATREGDDVIVSGRAHGDALTVLDEDSDDGELVGPGDDFGAGILPVPDFDSQQCAPVDCCGPPEGRKSDVSMGEEDVEVVDLARLMTETSLQEAPVTRTAGFSYTCQQKSITSPALSGVGTKARVAGAEHTADDCVAEFPETSQRERATTDFADISARHATQASAAQCHMMAGKYQRLTSTMVTERTTERTSERASERTSERVSERVSFAAGATVVLPPLIASKDNTTARIGPGARRLSTVASRIELHASSAFITDPGCFATDEPPGCTDPPLLDHNDTQWADSVAKPPPPVERHPPDFDVAVEMAPCFPELLEPGAVLLPVNGDDADAGVGVVVQTVREDMVLDPPTPFSERAALASVATRSCESPQQMTTPPATPPSEPLLRIRARKALQRRLLHEEMCVLRNAAHVRDRVVYDVDDASVADSVGDDALTFESRFESGNLRRAFQVHADMYDLVLAPDINAIGHTQWFFFSVSGMKVDTTYRFNIVNLEKSNSQYNFGMQPVVFSEMTAQVEGKGWHRCGTKICYYKNTYRRDHPRSKALYTATFSLSFAHAMDTCYIAYHFPFTYSDCAAHITQLLRTHPAALQRHLLCRTLGGNNCDVLTITSFHPDDARVVPMHERQYIVLSARVHPGESNSSWVMKGALDFLVSDHPTACQLRRRFVFKVIPMLNPDGVANGNHRCSLAGCDLNRKWRTPHSELHPTVFRTKMLFEYLRIQGITPALYCDFHGHSRKKMIFMYGCTNDRSVHAFPKHLASVAPQFSWRNSQFGVSSDKEGSARVVVWRQYGVERSYTMESTFCGFDRGVLRGNHIGTSHLEDMGRIFVAELLALPTQLVACEPVASTALVEPLLVRGNSWA
eukprot:m.439842 g.439842  ORF g.439842 m.439842 type:complete len:1247 (-) comp21458_c0_seq11:127-3867(-)